MVSPSEARTLYVGTYTRDGTSEGIYRFAFDADGGTLEPRGLAARADNPSFLTIAPGGRFLYAINEPGGPDEGGARAFGIDPADGSLTPLNVQKAQGRGGCHIAVDRTGRRVYVAHYRSGGVSVFPVGDDGALGAPTLYVQHEGSGPNAKRQEGPHAHSVNIDPTNRFLLVADLGTDKVVAYRLDLEGGGLPPHDVPFVSTAPGAGPRHLTFHPNGRFMFLINELNGTMSSYAWDAGAGSLEETSTVPTLPDDFTEANLCADVHVGPDGRHVYGSNRGHDSIVSFRIDESSGALAFVQRVPCGGEHPRNFMIDPGGRFLLVANMNTDNIAVFAIDPPSGMISPTGHEVEVPRPVCLTVLRR
jgi:6-phosphogluconolactonase